MRPLERFFYAYGKVVGRHPWPFIIVPTLLTLLTAYGFLYFRSDDDIWDLYAPSDGLSRVEEEALRPFEFASGAHHYRMQILVSRKDGGNLLEKATLLEINRANQEVERMNFGRGLNYSHVCGIYCNETNLAIIAFLETCISSSRSSSFQLTFPRAMAFQKRVFLGYSLGHLTFVDNSSQNNSLVASAKLFILHYMVDLRMPNGQLLAIELESRLREYFSTLSDASTSSLHYSLLSRRRELEEQRAISITSLPFLGLTILVLTVFMLLTLVRLPLSSSQHYEALIGVLSPGMALSTTFGLLWLFSVPFSNILTVVPFLVVTIGIDDAFLILAGYRQSDPTASLPERIGQSLVISGASATVTSFTDVICFAVGLLSNMPVVRLFCLYTTVALFLDFVYQVTFFTAFVAIIAQRKAGDVEKESNSDRKSTGTSGKWKPKFLSTSSSMSSFFSLSTKEVSSLWSVDALVSLLHKGITKTLVILIFAIHIAVSSYYATKVNTDFDMEKLYMADSPLTTISRDMQKFVLQEAYVVNVAIRPMPDVSNSSVRSRLMQLVEELERIRNYGQGEQATEFWMREYAEDAAFWGEAEDDASNMWSNRQILNNYRQFGIDEKFLLISKNSDGDEQIDGFYLSITYHNLSNFLEVEDLMDRRREIIGRYAEFNAYSHHPFDKVPTESASSAPSNFYQTSLSAMILMALGVLLFLQNFEAIFSVILSIFSICLGIVSYLHIWSVNLDAVSLISILMSIGFSVDYSAHICYHYFAHSSESSHETTDQKTKQQEPETYRRLRLTLGGVGWPVVQSGLSTILGMFPLMFVRAYVVAVFWKTVLLVGLLGMFHALLLLPVIFILTHDVHMFIQQMIRRFKTVPST